LAQLAHAGGRDVPLLEELLPFGRGLLLHLRRYPLVLLVEALVALLEAVALRLLGVAERFEEALVLTGVARGDLQHRPVLALVGALRGEAQDVAPALGMVAAVQIVGDVRSL